MYIYIYIHACEKRGNCFVENVNKRVRHRTLACLSNRQLFIFIERFINELPLVRFLNIYSSESYGF